MTHNRTKQAFEAILSVLEQGGHNFDLTVSDNSDTDSLGHLIQSNIQKIPSLSRVTYIKRPKLYPALEHFNLCLDEVASDYFCLFHDDDLMLPNFVAKFFEAQNLFPHAAAFGTNAIAEKNRINRNLFFQSAGSHTVGITPRVLAEKYFSRHQLGVAPFPSYIYKKSSIKSLHFDPGWGKYGDVTWLLNVACHGEIIWINQPLMIYRLHDGNDSLIESRRDRLKFLAFIKRSKNRFGPTILRDYRFFIFKKNLPILLDSSNKVRQANILKKYIFTYRIYRILRLDHHWHLIKKWKIRLHSKWFKSFGNLI